MPTPPKPPPEHSTLTLVAERLRINVPAIVALALIGATVAIALGHPGRPAPAPLLPSPLEPQVELQEWTVDAGFVPVLASTALMGELPSKPDPRQRRPPCVTKLGEEAINGYCWLRLDVPPPCPKDPDAYAFDHNGKCYAYALRAERPSTTEGNFRPGNVAGQ